MSKASNHTDSKRYLKYFLVYTLFSILFFVFDNGNGVDASIEVENDLPKIVDSNLKVEKFVEGLEKPTSMAFIGPDDILILEKDRGTVKRIKNGTILQEPLLDLNVANRHERGMLGIAVARDDKWIKEENRDNNKNKNPLHVFLYF